MNNDIKKILDELNKNKNEIKTHCYYPDDVLNCDELIKLLDYITNLQTIEQEYSAILSENAELENKVNNLEKENKRLKELCDRYEEEHKTTFEEWKKGITYKKRCQLAIEYIKENKHIDDYGKWIIEDDNYYLLNILNGGDNNE